MTNRTKAIISLSSVFLLGGICGALIFGVVIRDRMREAQGLRNQEGFINYFEKRLELTEAQRDSLHDELAQAYQDLSDLRCSASVRYNLVFDSLKSKIYPQLTADQRELFNAQEAKFRRFMPREPGGPPGGPAGGPGGRGPGHPGPEADRELAPPNIDTPPANDQSGTAAPKAPPGTAPMKLNAGVETAPNANASDSLSPEERIANAWRDRIAIIKKRLNLTADQDKQIRQIMQDVRDRNKQARTQYQDQPMMRKTALRDNTRQMQQRIAALLTDDQRQEFTKMRNEMREKWQAGAGTDVK